MTHLYHVHHKPLYAAIGEEENRNRRVVMPATIVRKLMTLDLVLRERDATWLATEDEKIAYLTTTGHVPLTVLPGLWYGGHGSGLAGTVRYCVDKAPMWVTADGAVSIAYVQGLDERLGGFRAFLDRYTRLLSALPAARVVWAAPSLTHMAQVRAAVAAWRARTKTAQAVELSHLRRDLTAYCDGRSRLEHGFSAAPVRDRRRVRALHTRVVASRFPTLYARWEVSGPATIDAYLAGEPRLDVAHVSFDTIVLRGRYDLFGTAFSPASAGGSAAEAARRIQADLAGSVAA